MHQKTRFAAELHSHTQLNYDYKSAIVQSESKKQCTRREVNGSPNLLQQETWTNFMAIHLIVVE